MQVIFNIAGTLVTFDMDVRVNMDIRVMSGVGDTGDSPAIENLLSNYADIDASRTVTLSPRDTIKMTDHDTREISEFYLHGSVSFFDGSETVEWYPSIIGLSSNILGALGTILDAWRPVIAGTAKHYLPSMKEQAKALVKARAAREAHLMRAEAEAILTFLGEPFYG